MKKILLSTLFFICMPAFALCPIDSAENVCSLTSSQENTLPMFQNSNNNANNNLNNTQPELQPMQPQNSSYKLQGINQNIKNNSNCQFGLCSQNLDRNLKN